MVDRRHRRARRARPEVGEVHRCAASDDVDAQNRASGARTLVVFSFVVARRRSRASAASSTSTASTTTATPSTADDACPATSHLRCADMSAGTARWHVATRRVLLRSSPRRSPPRPPRRHRSSTTTTTSSTSTSVLAAVALYPLDEFVGRWNEANGLIADRCRHRFTFRSTPRHSSCARSTSRSASSIGTSRPPGTSGAWSTTALAILAAGDPARCDGARRPGRCCSCSRPIAPTTPRCSARRTRVRRRPAGGGD